jgi:hypothetical protein
VRLVFATFAVNSGFNCQMTMNNNLTQFRTRNWLLLCIFNLFIVSVLGTLMRYKIGFPFPYFDQKHLQHAHSHFAFIGWMAQTLFVLMVHTVHKDRPHTNLKPFKILLIANLVCSYGMIISFAQGGYSPLSITLSSASVLISYIFAYYLFRELRYLAGALYSKWFTAALWFGIISSIGTFTLAYMMATHNFNQKIHLASLYFYLHFQYNGFFMFSCFGLLFYRMKELLPAFKYDQNIFWLLFFACIPGYMLSVLWIIMPEWLYILVILAAVAQVVAWGMFLKEISRAWSSRTVLVHKGRYLLLILAIAVTAKLLLQLGSTVPAVSKLAFGFRSVIIAYLHLILLAILSVFLVAYMYVFGYIKKNRMSVIAITLFVAGVYMNEIILGVQGIASFSYTLISLANESLFAVSCLIAVSIILILLSQTRRMRNILTELP